MKKDEIKKIISECCNDLIFIYDNKNAIITSTVSNYVPTFEATYNGKSKKYNDVDVLCRINFIMANLFRIYQIWALLHLPVRRHII